MSAPEFDPELYALRPWYHDFGLLGFDTTFREVPLTLGDRARRASEFFGSMINRARRATRTTSVREIFRHVSSPHALNQPVKEQHLMTLLESALLDLGDGPACLELFSADGYYSCRIKALSARARIVGVELDPEQVRRAEVITKRLDFQDVVYRREDAGDFLETSSDAFDLVLCAGGLYHLADPLRLLRALERAGRRFLVVQSVVTLETEDPTYFVQPAPGWRHGCRFTHAWLRARLNELGWEVHEESRAELPGNPRAHDRGSSFFLCHRR